MTDQTEAPLHEKLDAYLVTSGSNEKYEKNQKEKIENNFRQDLANLNDSGALQELVGKIDERIKAEQAEKQAVEKAGQENAALTTNTEWYDRSIETLNEMKRLVEQKIEARKKEIETTTEEGLKFLEKIKQRKTEQGEKFKLELNDKAVVVAPEKAGEKAEEKPTEKNLLQEKYGDKTWIFQARMRLRNDQGKKTSLLTEISEAHRITKVKTGENLGGEFSKLGKERVWGKIENQGWVALTEADGETLNVSEEKVKEKPKASSKPKTQEAKQPADQTEALKQAPEAPKPTLDAQGRGLKVGQVVFFLKNGDINKGVFSDKITEIEKNSKGEMVIFLEKAENWFRSASVYVDRDAVVQEIKKEVPKQPLNPGIPLAPKL